MKNAGKITHPGTVRFERILAGSPVRIWEYLTVPALLSTWLADVRINPVVGGDIELRKKGGAVVEGKITRFAPPRLLSYSWTNAAISTFELNTLDDRVQLVIIHSGLPEIGIEKICAGWHTHLEILAARLRGDKPEPFPVLFEHFLRSYKEHLKKEMEKERRKNTAPTGVRKDRRKSARGNDFV